MDGSKFAGRNDTPAPDRLAVFAYLRRRPRYGGTVSPDAGQKPQTPTSGDLSSTLRKSFWAACLMPDGESLECGVAESSAISRQPVAQNRCRLVVIGVDAQGADALDARLTAGDPASEKDLRMLWDVRALMKPVLSVVDMIPDVHRTPAAALLRRTVLEGRPLNVRLSPEDKDLAFHEAAVNLTSPIGARLLLGLYKSGHLKLKKPPRKSLPTLEAYAATEPEFRAKVAALVAAEEARRARLSEILADPSSARPDELTPQLIDRVISRAFGHAASASMEIAGVLCHREVLQDHSAADQFGREEPRVLCWWTDADGIRQGDSA